MCLYPKLIKNKKYQANKKNGGNIPPIVDGRTKYIPVGCQNCIECRKQKARGWQVRLLEDIKTNKNGKFITLTFSDEHINKLIEGKDINGKQVTIPLDKEGYELDNQIATRAMRGFLERWRKKYKKSIRHWMVTELGHNGTENIHLHGIIWTDEDLNDVEKIWAYGWVWKGKEYKGKIINYVSEKTVNYIIKYVTKIDDKHKEFKSKILSSKGIGANYTIRDNNKELVGDSKNNVFKGDKTDETYRTRTGHKIAMPVYWRNKIYSEEEREKLWIVRMDKEERWIMGNKVDISKGDKEYWEGLKWAREKNKRLGYGSDEKNWDREQYENDRRRMMIEKRRTKIINASAAASNQKG